MHTILEKFDKTVGLNFYAVVYYQPNSTLDQYNVVYTIPDGGYVGFSRALQMVRELNGGHDGS